MATNNTIRIIGRLGKSPEMSYKGADGDKAVTKASVAVDRRRSRDEATDWFNIVAFGQQAEFINQYGDKGRLVAVEGRMQNNKWEDSDGQTRNWWEVVVDDFQFLDRPPEADAE